MEEPLLRNQNEISLSVEKELLMSFFYKDNREKEGSELPMALKKMNISDLIRRLSSSRYKGISEDPKEMERRRQKYGTNILIPNNSHRSDSSGEYSDVNFSKNKSWCTYISDHFKDRIWRLLFLCAFLLIVIAVIEDYKNLLNMKLGDWVIGLTVLFILIVIMLLNIQVESCKHNGILRMLRLMEENIEVTVIRDSKEFLIKQSELLVGDVIILSGGDSIPVDCLVIEANLQAQVDESYLTPDINPVQKRTIKIFEETIEKGSGENKQNDEEIDTPDPFLLASTLVIAGRMKALV